MTRKDYKLIAKYLRDNMRDVAESQASGFAVAVEAVAFALKSDNPRFDSDRFVHAVLEG